MRTRRRRYGMEPELGDNGTQQLMMKKVKFMEEVDYKMQADDGDSNQREVKTTIDEEALEI